MCGGGGSPKITGINVSEGGKGEVVVDLRTTHRTAGFPVACCALPKAPFSTSLWLPALSSLFQVPKIRFVCNPTIYTPENLRDGKAQKERRKRSSASSFRGDPA